MPLVPAQLELDTSGTPYSSEYGDVYHSADSGPGQARHVFLAGNGLPERWRGTQVFTVVETGFGIGLNFLATWSAWREDAARCERLHYVSIEKHPLERGALQSVLARYAEFAPCARELLRAWPPLVSGLHRLHFENERLTLTLAFGDAGEMAHRLRLHADAFYLDGFAPRLNPDMWSPRVLRRLAGLARGGARFATYSTAAAVRKNLQDAGFALEVRPGYGRKREMLCGSYRPQRTYAEGMAAARRHAIVIGAGIAGAAVSERLARRGWQIDLIDARVPPQADALPKYAGAFHPHVSRDDCILSRATRNGFLYALRHWRALEGAGPSLTWSRCGVLQLAQGAADAARMRAGIEAMAFPPEYARYVDRIDAEGLAGCALAGGGCWFPGGGWLRPLTLIAAQLAAAGPELRAHFGAGVAAIAHASGQWQALDGGGRPIAAAPVMVLANAHDATRLANFGQDLQLTRGQVSYVPAQLLTAPRAVLAGNGYLLPAFEDFALTGSTYDRDDFDPLPQLRGHQANLARLAQLLPQAGTSVDAGALEGAVGFRCAAPDHLPLVGALPDIAAVRANKSSMAGAALARLPRRDGLYCAVGYASRGLVWSALAAEVLASRIEGEPLPLEGDLADALDPARFVAKQVRRA